MTTTELTGAEEVAWDLSDLYEGSDDPRIEQHIAEAEAAAAEFHERYHGKVAGLDAAELADAIAERERIEEILMRVGYYAHLNFSTDMADAPRGALVARITEKGAQLDTQLLFFGLEIAALDDAATETLLASPALEHWRHWLHSLRKFRPYLLSEPEEKIMTEKTVSGVSAWDRLFDELLGALKVDVDGDEISFEEALARLQSGTETFAARPQRRSPSRWRRGFARAPSSSTRSWSTSRSTTACAGTRRGSRRGTSRTRRPTRPCRRSSTRSPRATTSRSATTR